MNISWSPLPLVENDQLYTVTVRDSESNVVISSQLGERYIVFNATNNAPPYEVYKVSVTATYVGATYSGAGCSEPSNETFMLPSLFSTNGTSICLPTVLILFSIVLKECLV